MINTQAKYIYPAHGKLFLKSDLIMYKDNLNSIKLY